MGTTTTCKFGEKPIARAEVLAWEARRAAVGLRRMGLEIPPGDVMARRTALVEAKLERGRSWAEERFARQVGVTDRLVGRLARASKRRRRCQVELFVAGASAAGFPAWYETRAEADDDRAMLSACPDHHLFRPTGDGGQEVWETTGGSPLVSRFFFTKDETDSLVTEADPGYPVQLAGTARTKGGTVIGGVRHQFRDEAGGTRALLTVEFPWLIGPVTVAMHRWHLACEFMLWLEASGTSPDSSAG